MEFRPQESARTVIAQRLADGSKQTLTPEGYSAQTEANEYGGICYTVGDGNLFFVNADDQHIYSQELNKTSQPLCVTSKNTQGSRDRAIRFADLIFDPNRSRIIAVAEVHTTGTQTTISVEPETQLVSIDIANGQIQTLAEGADFYANPRISPDGKQILWLEWNHPNMPWDETRLCVSGFDQDSHITNTTRIGEPNESIFQPEWSPSNQVYFVSDRNQWWNIFRYEAEEITPVYSIDRECGLPLWQFGMTTWGFTDEDNIFVISSKGAEWRLETLCISIGTAKEVSRDFLSPYNHFCDLAVNAETGSAAVIASGPATQPELCLIDEDIEEIIASSGGYGLSEQDIAKPEEFRFSTSNGDEAYGYAYPPTNSSYAIPGDEEPPLIVLCHGGPTASTTAAFNLKVQFWTSRGFAVADINYRGSTGYGRSYRDKLKGNWGLYDVDDACAAATYLSDKGLVDSDRLIIRGSSAGGYTVLSALCFKDVFTAGCSLYGIGDLTALVKGTHKFESRYIDSLVASPEQQEIYAARSPIQHIDGFSCPTIFFQGLKDKVVPPDQAESMVKALSEKQVPVTLITYAEEAHGFRDPINVSNAFNSELAFYGKVFGFETDSNINLDIQNMERH